MGGGGGGCGVSVNEYSCAHGAQTNFGDLTPYLKGQCQKIFCFRFFFFLNYLEIFVAEFFTQSKPVWVDDLGTRK